MNALCSLLMNVAPNAEYFETTISETNDYSVFPNFESIRSPRFVSLFDFLVPEASVSLIGCNMIYQLTSNASRNSQLTQAF